MKYLWVIILILFVPTIFVGGGGTAVYEIRDVEVTVIVKSFCSGFCNYEGYILIAAQKYSPISLILRVQAQVYNKIKIGDVLRITANVDSETYVFPVDHGEDGRKIKINKRERYKVRDADIVIMTYEDVREIER